MKGSYYGTERRITGLIAKAMDAERKKAEREKRMSELADLMDEKGYTIEDLEKLMTMPKPEVTPTEEQPTSEE